MRPKKTNTVWFHFYEVAKILRFIKREQNKAAGRAGVWRDGELVCSECEFCKL